MEIKGYTNKPDVFEKKIEFLKGVGPQRAQLLQEELDIYTFGDLYQFFPFRYEDRSKFYRISDMSDMNRPYQLILRIDQTEIVGERRKKRLVAIASDETGSVELVWFQGITWISKKIVPRKKYVVYGRPSLFKNRLSMAHPELELATEQNIKKGGLEPVYHSTDKLRKRYLDSKGITKLTKTLIQTSSEVPEIFPKKILDQHGLMVRSHAFAEIHHPSNLDSLRKSRYRLKFEELFLIQVQLLRAKVFREKKYAGHVFGQTALLTKFYEDHLPFELTGAQKKVIREIFDDFKSGSQMNRLLQGDVGSGKTLVAFICMLLAVEGGSQCAFMAPTEILADQHYQNLMPFCERLDIQLAKLTGSTKGPERKVIYKGAEQGNIHILVGTHALIQDKVKFKNLGLAVIDEQHRFGVAQRAKLWSKNEKLYPHVLVMTATPIPRTLAMTLYGDLDVSIIDELPKGRKPIKTTHYFDSGRLKIFGFVQKQVELGRQVYVVYPLIEESATLELKDLMDGYESISRAFPQFQIGVLHGRMKPEDKDFEMDRFKKGQTQILVSTTVVEVGVDIPNASVMVIENAEKFGLSQLHQLRGRVGRGAAQSFCILMTGNKLTKEARTRIKTMVRTNDGFEIADVDLKLRGPGEISGTRQSGVLDLKIADLSQDAKLLQVARQTAKELLAEDHELKQAENIRLRQYLDNSLSKKLHWNRIS